MTTRSLTLLALSAALAAGTPPLAAQERPERPERPERIERIEVIREGSPSRGWLGVFFDAQGEGEIPVVREVYPGSPAERAGLRRGDVVVRMDGEPARMEAVRALRLSPGDTVRLRVRREGREQDVPVVAGEREGSVVIVRTDGRERVFDVDSIRRMVAMRMDSLGGHLDSLFVHMDSLRHRIRTIRPGELVTVEVDTLFARRLPETLPFSIEFGARALAGAEFTQMNPGLGRYFRTDEGLLVLRVAPGSPAAEAGLEAGDVLLRVDGAEVETLRDLRQAIVRARRDEQAEARLEVLRQGQPREVQLKWSASPPARIEIRRGRPPAPPRTPR